MRRSILTCLFLTALRAQAICAEGLEEQLWKAAKTGDAVAVKALLEQGVDPDSRTKYGVTALAFACDRGHPQVARVLLDAGANVNIADSFYQATPLDNAVSKGHTALVALLLETGADGADAALRQAVRQKSVEMVQAVLDSADLQPEWIFSAKALASDLQQKELMKLLENAADTIPHRKLQVSSDTLQSYVGSYRDNDGTEIQVKLREGFLTIQTGKNSPIAMVPKGESAFTYFRSAIEFHAKDGVVGSFTRTTSHKTTTFTRASVLASGEKTGDQPPAEPDVKVASRRGPVDVPASSRNWPSFRGAGARGIADGQSAPSVWNVEESTGVRWKTPIPGLGHSSPVVWENNVFVTTAVGGGDDVRIGLYGDVDSVEDESVHSWQIFCLDKRSGGISWNRESCASVPTVKRHLKSTHANPTPATDGRHVVVSFGSEGLYCYDVDGTLLWDRPLGALDSGWFFDPDYEWGFGSSPIIFNGMVIVQCDRHEDSFVAAYDVNTGEQIWRTPRDEIPSWGTPTAYETEGGAILVTNASHYVRGYDALTGKELWRLSGNSEITVPTPFVAYDLIFVASGYRPVKPIYAIRLGARGDISLEDGANKSQNIAWSKARGGPYLPTPIAYRGYLYCCDNSGILTCYDARTGERIYRQRLRAEGAKSFTAAPVAADGNLYFTSEQGIVLVVKAGPQFELLHANRMGDSCLATPAISDGLFIIRTLHHVIAVGDVDND